MSLGDGYLRVYQNVDKKKSLEEAETILKELKSRLQKIESVDEAQTYLDLDGD